MTPYIGEIRIFAGTYQPNGWMFCDGTELQISQHDALFTLIGTTYGGDGQETFRLPDLRGRLPMGAGQFDVATSFQVGELGGSEAVTLTTTQLPVHSHTFRSAASTGNEINPVGNLPANSVQIKPYINQGPDVSMSPAAIAPVGGSQPHENRQPYLGVHFIISLFGIFPSPT